MFARNLHWTRDVPLNHDKTMEEVGHCLDLDESRLQLRFLELNQPSNFAVYEGKYKLHSITGTTSSYTSIQHRYNTDTALDTNLTEMITMQVMVIYG